MTDDELDIFVVYVDEGWQPPLTETQRAVWRKVAQHLDPKTVFPLVLKMIETDRYRPKLPEFKEAYRRARVDTTASFTAPQAVDEMPDWVRGWSLARAEGDWRLWPEQEIGFRQNHDNWVAESAFDANQRKKFEIKSGYEWEDAVEKFGLMDQEDRLTFIARAKAPGQEEALDAILSAGAAPGTAAE